MSLTQYFKADVNQLRKRSAPILMVALLAFAAAAQAQSYATKRISFVVPWPAGGATDVVARLLSNELQTSLGQPVIVENIVGAGGIYWDYKSTESAGRWPHAVVVFSARFGTGTLQLQISQL